MWAVQLVGSLNKVYTQFKNTWGYALSVLNYRQVHGLWKSVTWTTTKSATAIVTPVEDGCIEITDLFFSALKAAGSTVTLYFTDGTNTETWILVLLTNEAVRITHSVSGRMTGWRNAVLTYTVTGANSDGSIMVGYVKHTPDTAEDYSVWDSKR